MVVNRSQGSSIIFMIDRLFLLVYWNSFSINATARFHHTFIFAVNF